MSKLQCRVTHQRRIDETRRAGSPGNHLPRDCDVISRSDVGYIRSERRLLAFAAKGDFLTKLLLVTTTIRIARSRLPVSRVIAVIATGARKSREFSRTREGKGRDFWRAEERNNSMRSRCIREYLLDREREKERDSVRGRAEEERVGATKRREGRERKRERGRGGMRRWSGLVHHPCHDRCQWDLGYQVMLLGICISWPRRMHERGEAALSLSPSLSLSFSLVREPAGATRWKSGCAAYTYRRARRGRMRRAYRVLPQIKKRALFSS